MANPQLEDGRTDIANELTEALALTCFNATESRLLWAILRQTYGWHKKTDRISYTQFERLTGLSRRHIAPGLEKLLSRNIVIQEGTGHRLFYGIQKNYELWRNVTHLSNVSLKSLPNKVTNKNVPYLSNTPLPTQVTKTLPTQVNTKARKHLYKSKTAADFTKFINSLKTKYPELDIDTEWQRCQLWWAEGNRMMKRPQLALFNWLEKERRIRRGNGNGSHRRNSTKLPPRDGYTEAPYDPELEVVAGHE